MKGKIRAIIVDDEMPARENLKFMLADYCPEVSVVGLADGVESGKALFEAERPSLVFLDIRMPSGSEGFELLDKLEGDDFFVVFVTAFKDYAIRAFENRALHYILKPIDEGDLQEVVQRIIMRKSLLEKGEIEPEKARLSGLNDVIKDQKDPTRITIHHSKGIKIVEVDDIDYLESSGNCTILHFSDGSSYLDTRTLKVYEALVPQHFFRTHRSYMINLRQVSEILHGNDQSVIIKSGKSLPFSRDKKKELISAITNLG